MTPVETQPDSRWRPVARWKGIARPYQPSDVRRLRGSVRIEHTLATLGAEKLWALLQSGRYVAALGAQTGTQAVQMVRAGLGSIYASGWQVAADANGAGETYPDQSLYPSDSMPALVRRINNAFRREDQKQTSSGEGAIDWFAPIVADAEAGFGGVLNAFELTKALIEAGAAGIHFEDQLSSVKKCGHLGGKVLVPVREFNQKLWAARLAADVLDVPTLLVARTDALSASLVTSDVDPRDQPFLSGERTPEGFFTFRGGIDAAIGRALASAPFADLLWFETASPDLNEARTFAEAVHGKYPGKPLAYNCSPSFHWRGKLRTRELRRFQEELGGLGYRYQFVTLAGFHAINLSMFELARGYSERGMEAYADLQDRELAATESGYEAVRHQRFVGTEYFDEVTRVLSGGLSSTLAMQGSTEREQFSDASRRTVPGPRPGVRAARTRRAETTRPIGQGGAEEQPT